MKISKIIINDKTQGYLFKFQILNQSETSTDIKGSPKKHRTLSHVSMTNLIRLKEGNNEFVNGGKRKFHKIHN